MAGTGTQGYQGQASTVPGPQGTQGYQGGASTTALQDAYLNGQTITTSAVTGSPYLATGYTAGGNGQDNITSVTAQIGQSFNISSPMTIVTAKINLQKWGNVTGTLIAYIQGSTSDTTTGIPNGTILATSTPVNISALTGADYTPTLLAFNFPSPATTLANKRYHLVLGYGAGSVVSSNGMVQGHGDYTNNYAYGYAVDGGPSSWYNNNTTMQFELWSAASTARPVTIAGTEQLVISTSGGVSFTNATGAAASLQSIGAERVFNGVEDATQYSLAYNASTRQLTVTCTGTAAYTINGVRYVPTTTTTTAHASTNGLWFFSYAIGGTITISQTPWSLFTSAPIATVYYNSSNRGSAAAGILNIELHAGRDGMDNATHTNLHTTRGTQLLTGVSASGYTLNTSGLASTSYALSAGQIADEDLVLPVSVQLQGGANTYRIFWQTGTSGSPVWNWIDNAEGGIYSNGTDIYYNQLTGGSWQLTAVSANAFLNYWVLATDAYSAPQAVVFMGQTTYATLALAQAATFASEMANLGAFAVEGVVVYQMSYQRGAFGAPGNIRLRSAKKVTQSVTSVAAGATTVASAVTVDTAGFTGRLGATDTTVQQALNDLDTNITPVTLGGTGVAVSSGASSVMLRDANQNVTVNNVSEGFATTATAAGTTTLTAASAPLQQFTGTTTQTVVLPNATTLSAGFIFQILNRSTGSLTIKDGGSTTILTMVGGSQAELICSSIGSAAGTWDQSYVTSTASTTLQAAYTGGQTIATTSGGSTSAALVQQDTGGSTNAINTTTGRLAQSFNIATGGTIGFAKLWLNKTGALSGTFYVTLQTDSGNPSGTILATSNVVDFASLGTTASWITFTFPAPYTYTGGTTYWLVMQLSAGAVVDGSNYMQAQITPTNPYAGGFHDLYTGSWTQYTSWDMAFELWTPNGTARPVAISGTESLTVSAAGGVNVSNAPLVLSNAAASTITVTPPAVLTSWNMILPASAGTSGQMLSTNGSGVTSWSTPPTPATGTLQASYTGGSTITTSAISGATLITANNGTQGTSQGTIYNGSPSAARYGQAFMLATGGTIGLVKFWMQKGGSPSGTFTVQIMSSTNNLMDGTTLPSAVLATSDAVNATSVGTSGSWVSIPFSTPFTFSANTCYHLVFTAPTTSDSGNCFQVLFSASGNPYALGFYVGCGTNGNFFNAVVAGGDLGFEIWTPSTSPNPVTIAGTEALKISSSGGLTFTNASTQSITVTPPASLTPWSMTLPTSAGTTGQALTTNGSGVTSWSTPAGTLQASYTGGSTITTSAISGATLITANNGTQGTSQGTIYNGSPSAARYGQAFMLATGGTIGLVKFWMQKGGSPSGTFTVQIMSSTNNLMDGTTLPSAVLATSDAVNATSVGTSGSWVSIPFSTPFTFSANTCYHLVFTAPTTSDSGNCFQVLFSASGNPYALGFYVGCGTNGNFFNAVAAGGDLGFELWTSASTPNPVVIAGTEPLRVSSTGGLQVSNGTNYVTLKTPTGLAANATLPLPGKSNVGSAATMAIDCSTNISWDSSSATAVTYTFSNMIDGQTVILKASNTSGSTAWTPVFTPGGGDTMKVSGTAPSIAFGTTSIYTFVKIGTNVYVLSVFKPF